MMDWTTRHCRYFHRLLAPEALLFTEMVTAEAILHAGPKRFCQHDASEHPLALQLGGADAERLAAAVAAVGPFGFDEINLNVGACLMAEPKLVAGLVRAMKSETERPVTVKCRIGIDDMDPEEGLDRFIDIVGGAGATVIYLHARKAWLNGLSPKENRDIPPLDYDRAARLALRYPELDIILNGGLTDSNQISDAILPLNEMYGAAVFAGVMVGRSAYQTPDRLADMAADYFGHSSADRYDVLQAMTHYAATQMQDGIPLNAITRHMLGLFHGKKGARLWRQRLGEEARNEGVSADLILTAASSCLALLSTERVA
jgi:tRNA-dihydrouridine synthase A